MRPTKLASLLLAGFLTLLFAAAQADDAEKATIVTISLRPNALVRGQEFTIGEIADLLPAEGEVAEQIRKTVVAHSPWPGYTQRVNQGLVLMALRGRVKNLSAVRIEGAEQCAVNIAAVKIEGKTFFEAAQKHLLQQLPWPAEQVEISCSETLQDRYVPIGLGAGPVLEVTDGDRQKERGQIRLQLRVIVDGESVYQTSASFHVKTFQDVMVTAENMSKGDLLTAENTSLERREVTDFSLGFFTQPKDVYGKRATRSIRAGIMLTTKMLQTPPVVSNKSMVDILYRSSNLTITLKGIAEEPGAPGDIVRVRNLSTRRQLYCQVIDSHTVQVASK